MKDKGEETRGRRRKSREDLNATLGSLSKWKTRKSKKLSSLTNIRVVSQSKSLTVSKRGKTTYFYIRNRVTYVFDEPIIILLSYFFIILLISFLFIFFGN